MGKFIDLTGKRFNKLTVIERAENKGSKVCWRCRCDCGNECIVHGSSLKSGTTRSCGCWNIQSAIERSTVHGKRHSKIYGIWCTIKNRCFKSAVKGYERYGGRGITLYEPWIDDFQAFYDYVSTLEHFGEDGYSLDRINNDGNYEPGNLRWATKSEQARNTRRNIIVEYKGVEMTLAEAAELSGISYGTLQSRYRAGDRGARLFRPVRKKKGDNFGTNNS